MKRGRIKINKKTERLTNIISIFVLSIIFIFITLLTGIIWLACGISDSTPDKYCYIFMFIHVFFTWGYIFKNFLILNLILPSIIYSCLIVYLFRKIKKMY